MNVLRWRRYDGSLAAPERRNWKDNSMLQMLDSTVKMLPVVASSPMALVAYALLLTAWLVVALKVKRNKNLLANLEKLPPEHRLRALEIEMGSVRLSKGLNAEQWIRTRIHRYYFLAFALLCIVVLIITVVAFRARELSEARLEVVEAAIDDIQENSFPTLDIKIRNLGDKVAFIKTMILHVSKIEHLENPVELVETHVDISWKYNASLRLTDYPYDLSVPLSQSVNGNDVDRFAVALAYDELKAEALLDDLARRAAVQSLRTGDTSMKNVEKLIDDVPDKTLFGMMLERTRLASIIVLGVEVIYNAEEKHLRSRDLMFLMPRFNHYIMATAIQKPNASAIVAANRKKAESLAGKFDGTISPGVKRLMASAPLPK